MDTPRKHTVLAADAEPLGLRGLVAALREMPGLEVCGEADSVGRIKELCAKLRPNILVMDPAQGDGFGLLRELPCWSADTKVVALTRLADADSVQRAIRSGVLGYVLRSDDLSALETAISSALAGERHLGPGAQRALLGEMARGTIRVAQSELECLSPREVDVFRRIGEGRATRAIAEELGMSVKTVETHRQRIREKLGLATGVELMRHAVLLQQSSRITPTVNS